MAPPPVKKSPQNAEDGRQQQQQQGTGPKEEFPSTGISEVPSETLYVKAIKRPSIIVPSKKRSPGVRTGNVQQQQTNQGSPYKIATQVPRSPSPTNQRNQQQQQQRKQ